MAVPWRKPALWDLGPELGIDLQVPHIDVTESRFGAKGDGVTDDTVAIQAAINAASSAALAVGPLERRTVVVPVGRFKVTHSGPVLQSQAATGIVMKPNVDLLGLGGTIVCPKETGISGESGQTVIGIDAPTSHFSIRNLRFDGGETGATAEDGHYCITGFNYTGSSGMTDFQIENNEIYGFRNKGVIINGDAFGTTRIPSRFRINNNYIHHFGHGNAIGLGYNATDFEINGNYMMDSYTPGGAESIILFANADRFSVNRNISVNWGNMALSTMSNGDIIGNKIYQSTGGLSAACALTDSGGVGFKHVRWLFNVFDATAGSSASADGFRGSDAAVMNDCTIAFNTFRGATNRVDLFMAQGGLNVLNCHIYSNDLTSAGNGTGYSMWLQGTWTGTIVERNRFNNPGAIFNLGTTGQILRDNPMLPDTTALTYGATIATQVGVGKQFTINATNGTAFTISNPTGALKAGEQLTYDIKNSSGGAMGAITWDTAFKLAGAFTNPANTKRRTITFYYDGTNWVETNRAAADI